MSSGCLDQSHLELKKGKRESERKRAPSPQSNAGMGRDRTLTEDCNPVWGSEVRAGSSESVMLVK